MAVTDERRGADDDTGPLDLVRWQALALAVLAAEGVQGPAELQLTFVDEVAMAALNAEHMGEEGPTDVLSFPLDPVADPAVPGVAPRLLGDVVVCPAVASRHVGGGRGAEFDAELALLVVHGVLHVLGMDHAEHGEAAIMAAREQVHLAAIGVERP